MNDDNIYDLMEMKNAESICERENIDNRKNIINNIVPYPRRTEFRSYPTNSDNNFCVIKPTQKNLTYSDSIGYECLYEKNTLLLNPERKNTFHNYPVYDENDNYCTKNHQIYNNWTRRGTQMSNDTPKQSDFNYEKIPELEYHKCAFNNGNKNINVPFSCMCKQ